SKGTKYPTFHILLVANGSQAAKKFGQLSLSKQLPFCSVQFETIAAEPDLTIYYTQQKEHYSEQQQVIHMDIFNKSQLLHLKNKISLIKEMKMLTERKTHMMDQQIPLQSIHPKEKQTALLAIMDYLFDHQL